MKITKFGHSCFLLALGGKRVVFDPGQVSTGQNQAQNVDLALITHEHFDHFDVDSLLTILKNNPGALIVTNTAVGNALLNEKVPFTKIEAGESVEMAGLTIEAFGNEHIIFGDGRGKCQNTGYLVNGEFFYAGDAYTIPNAKVRVLGFPVGGPWFKSEDALAFAATVKPEICVPLHDGLADAGDQITAIAGELKKIGITFVPLPLGEEIEIK